MFSDETISPPSFAPNAAVARRVERFRLEKELGRGGTATVHLAVDEASGERVCVKLFHPELFRAGGLSPRVQREMKLAAQLAHPNIVQVLGSIEAHDPPALILEYIDGENLGAFQSRLPYVLPELSVWIAAEILRALELAHERGIIHRDLKPENVLVDRQGRVLVTDFGLAKAWESTALTQSNRILGSIDYMSPEQARGDALTPASDLFSVGAILYFLTTGTRPFARSGWLATLAAIRDEDPEPPQRRNPKLSAPLSRLILKALAKDPAARPASATEFREALASYLHSLGLERALFRLELWRRDPSGHTLEALNTAAEKLATAADVSLRRRDWDAFLETLQHLAVKAPESPAVARLTTQYGRARRKTWKRLWAAGVVFGSVALFGAWNHRRPHSRPPSPTPVARPPVSPAPRLGRVRFELPSGVRVLWDGRAVDPSRTLERVPPGHHRLRLERRGFEPISAEVTVKTTEPTVIRVGSPQGIRRPRRP